MILTLGLGIWIVGMAYLAIREACLRDWTDPSWCDFDKKS